MPKRFADTKLFDQSWFLDLSIESKMIWLYLERSCDHAGVWEIDIPQMRRKLGSKQLNLINFLDEINKDYSKTSGEPIVVTRVMPIHNNTKLWLTGFVSEQYEKGLNGINTVVPAIKSVVNRLKDEGIFEFALKEGFIRIQKSTPISNEDLSLALNADKTEETCSNDKALPLNILAAKGSEPLERDKDKDKDKDIKYGSNCSNDFLKEIGGVGERTIEPPETENVKDNNSLQTDEPGSDLSPVTSKASGSLDNNAGGDPGSLVNKLFTAHWGKKPHTPHEEVKTAQFILDHGYDEVQIAFGEAVNHNRLTLAYVKGVLQKRRMNLELQRSEELKKEELHRLTEKGNEERKRGIKLNLIQSVYGN